MDWYAIVWVLASVCLSSFSLWTLNIVNMSYSPEGELLIWDNKEHLGASGAPAST